MIQIGILGIPQVQAAFQRLASDQLPFALSVALNRTAFSTRKALQARMTTAFVNPTPLIKGANRVKSSTKETLTATVYVDPRRAPVLYVHEIGGQRGNQMLERFLKDKGWLSGRWKAIPAENMPLNASGNPKQTEVKRIIAQLSAGISGDKSNPRRCFVIPPGGRSHLAPGIYRTKSRSNDRAIMMLYQFKPVAIYKPRLNWQQTAMSEAQRLLPIEAAKAVQRAIETARP